MRAHDGHVKDDGLTEAVTGKPATVTLAAESVTAGPVLAANVRVPPAAGYALKAAGGPAASSARDAGTGDVTSVRGAGGAWCTDDNTGDIADAGRAAEAAEVRDATRRPGRPRSERAEQAIIDATIEALGEHGIDGVRCEDVAARAGVGKATLYRRWAGKEDLLIAAFAAMRRPLPEPRGDSVRADLISLLTVVAADADDPRSAQQYALLHGAGERYPRLVARYKERVIEPRRERVRSVLRRGIETGELRSDIDVEVAMLLLTGAVMARGKHDPTPAAPGFVESAVDELLLGISSR